MNKTEIEKITESIEKYVLQKKDYNEIMDLLSHEYGLNRVYIRKIIKDNYHAPINTIIKKHQLKRAYTKWKNQGSPKLKEKDVIDEVKGFKSKFRSAFGCNPEDAYLSDVLLSFYMPGGEWDEFLDASSLVDSYINRNGRTEIYWNKEQLFIYIMSMPVHIIPRKLWEKAGWHKNKEMIVIFSLWFQSDFKDVIEVTDEEYSKQMAIMDMYDIDNPTVLDDIIILPPQIKETELCKVLHNILVDKIDSVLPYIDVVAKEYVVPYVPHLRKLVKWKSERDIENSTIDSLADYLGMEKSETVEMIWENITKGLLRYTGKSLYSCA